ncbi:hypothetical protein ABT160_26760 [Streptomyces sp. NPDC001941]|uniref:hypothetical protein n=1 Tax=Streptomyces sp. NPDC001941 TaxID=3154659 RepID=UPI003329496D
MPPEDPTAQARFRHSGIAAFAGGAAATLIFIAFFPGLPHVIDTGSILMSLAVGTLCRWAHQSHLTKKQKPAP